jgi:hypothetical protein
MIDDDGRAMVVVCCVSRAIDRGMSEDEAECSSLFALRASLKGRPLSGAKSQQNEA